jgi:hypothetical protein
MEHENGRILVKRLAELLREGRILDRMMAEYWTEGKAE